MVGLSNADPDQIRLAHAVLGDALVSVQNQFSPAFRSSRPEIDVCEELGLAFLPWSPLGGLADAKGLADKHPAFKEVADGARRQRPAGRAGVGARPVAGASSRSRGPSGRSRSRDSAAAADLELTEEEVARLDAD